MAERRRKYDAEFKREAVRLTEQGGKSVVEVAQDLGVPENQLYRWRRAMALDGAAAFPGKGRMKPMEEENRRLKRELAGVAEERDILKKALAFFSRTSR